VQKLIYVSFGGKSITMNEQTRYVMAIYELGIIIRDSMEYLLPPGKNGFDLKVYQSRKQMCAHLIDEKSPFQVFCNNNKAQAKDSDITVGEKISNQVHEFCDDVYGDDSRIVKVDHDKVVVETSLLLQLMDYCIGLHETISDICLGFQISFEKAGNLEPDLKQLLLCDDPFYRSIAFRSIATVFVLKFAEYNTAVKSYVLAERTKNGVDPTKQPGFDPKVDPSCAFISNEMTRVIGFFNFLRTHNKSHDVIFEDSIKRMQDDFHYFDGSKKLAEGQKLQDAMKKFEATFLPVIPGYRDAWVRIFNKIFAELNTYEKEMIQKAGAAKVVTTGEVAAEEAKEEATATAEVKEEVNKTENEGK